MRILAGDFDATLDHAELRDVAGGGYEDAGDVLGSGLRTTWPSDPRTRLPVTIDHVLADACCAPHSLDTFPMAGSDHRALLGELALPPR